MKTNYYRSLDRDLALFGVKGRWIGIFGIIMLTVILLAIIMGIAFDAGIGTAVFIAGFAGAFVVCLFGQMRYPSRRLPKIPASRMMKLRVRRAKTLAFILSQK